MAKFIETTFKNNLAQIVQPFVVLFSYAKKTDDGYTNSTPWFMCRDFLGDIVQAHHTEKQVSIYGFTAKHDNTPQPKTKLELAIKFKLVKDARNFKENIERFRADMEADLKVSLGKVIETDDKKVIVMSAPVFWRKTIPAISFYSFLIKCLSYQIPHNQNVWDVVTAAKASAKDWTGAKKLIPTTESRYVSTLGVDRLNKFMKNIKKICRLTDTPHGWPDNTETIIIHNNSGFYSICAYQLKPERMSVYGRRFWSIK